MLWVRIVNAAMGDTVVGPGDVYKLQEEVLEACRIIMIKVPEKKRLRNAG